MIKENLYATLEGRMVNKLKKEGLYKEGKTKLSPDPKELAMGIRVEREHSDDPEAAKQIALDHLTEDPKYYTHLAEMEKTHMEKAKKMPIGTVSRGYKKIAEGKWVKVKQGRKASGKSSGIIPTSDMSPGDSLRMQLFDPESKKTIDVVVTVGNKAEGLKDTVVAVDPKSHNVYYIKGNSASGSVGGSSKPTKSYRIRGMSRMKKNAEVSKKTMNDVVGKYGFDFVDDEKSMGGIGMDLEKSNYLKRWKGKDGKWQYMYANSRGELSSSRKKSDPKGKFGSKNYDVAHDTNLHTKWMGVASKLPKGTTYESWAAEQNKNRKVPKKKKKKTSGGSGERRFIFGTPQSVKADMKKSMGGTRVNKELGLLLEKAGHPAGTSAVSGKIKSKIPYTGHEERMKFAKEAAARMCPKPEGVKAGKVGTVDMKGRAKGQKAPYSSYDTKVSGMGSKASDLFGKK